MTDDEQLALALSDITELKVMLRAQMTIGPDLAVIKRDIAGIFAHLAKLNGTVAEHGASLQKIDDYHKNVADPLIPVVLATQKFQTETMVALRIAWAIAGVISTIIVSVAGGVIYKLLLQ